MISLGLAPFRTLGPRFFAELARLDYRAVDLQCDSDIDYMRSFDAVTFSAWLREAGLSLSCVSNVHDVERICHASRTTHVNADFHARRTIELATRLGAKMVRLYFGCPDLGAMFYRYDDDCSWKNAILATAERALPILEFARDRGLKILVEPHPRQSLFTLADVDTFRAAIGDAEPSLGVAFDPANIAAGGLDPLQYLQELGKPDVLHLKDIETAAGPRSPEGAGWRRYGPGPFVRFRRPSVGELDWSGIAATLATQGFRGPAIVELEDPTGDANDFLEPAARSARFILRSII